MKPAPFDLVRPSSLADAVALLATPGARALAGGQSLVPQLAARTARPTVLVDLAGCGLDDLEVRGDVLHLGALVRHRRLELDPVVREHAPLLAEAAALVGSPAIRNRGTLGGSLAHADPVAELPAALTALDATVEVLGPSGRRRTMAAHQVASGPWRTSLGPGELIVAIRVPLTAPVGSTTGVAFCELSPRPTDFAMVGVGAVVHRSASGTVTGVRAAGCGVGGGPVDLSGALVAAIGCDALDDDLLRDLAAAVAGSLDPPDVRGRSGAERRSLGGLYAVRALARAFTRADPEGAAATAPAAGTREAAGGPGIDGRSAA